MLFLAAGLGLVMGLVIGALGGGGGVLTVPLLVYALGVTAQSATTSSIIIVGITALVGTLARIRGGGIDWRTGLIFGALGIPSAFLGTLLNRNVDQQVLLLAFAAVTVLAATAMLINSRPEAEKPAQPADGSTPCEPSGGGTVATATRSTAGPTRARRRFLVTAVKVVLSGIVVGFMTGFLGVGGGFLVVPALVIILRMPMTAAIGTSLLIITLNAVTSMASRLGSPLDLDWRIVVPFTVLAVVGSFLGKRVADRLSGQLLTRAFAIMLILVGGFVAAEALGLL
ncbi:sulfite exporter TauE/SafE family protein [Pseudonocardia sp. KRD-184]|uniref:Probable membrane transporter protein n=1 Tax=Pseudonocardia oceani TaxID=2792013 RepID=A0ABS6U4F3_9PSEU|nr:sulfite exporter TauE/SafE family protein [Pseudonocardia oceani]MBW0092169.1 sulfite exporter TauE/SafE family protein [Pseudonocardia oceani]MBW0099137.1 sulfite exporter TauE/SafE family protein [Pseudonocardia oceani]MBW0122518.1 sulfite exporter TauE/SafE family protein [Pseudonocardia oceani]MBW0127039.1 sulfite exporter TauE/SafE family protein [Pseudonocardia oceani]